MKHFLLLLPVGGLLLGAVWGQQAPRGKREKPPFVPGTPAFTPSADVAAFDADEVVPDFIEPEAFQVADDLEVTVWARSPQLHNPTNLDIDHAGRIWVTEGVNYRRHSGRSRDGDAIRVLQDTNGDGVADQSHVFVREKGLEAPMGIAVFDNVIIVSNTPDIIVYTDVDRNLVFDPEVDKREVLLTGFEQIQHDHALHSVIGGPDGRLYFSNGNCGAYFTDKSGKTFAIGGGYIHNSYTGEPSDDGHVYVGGFAARMDPDGSNVRILGHNFRNPYEQVLTSFGDHFQNDNDDPPACRVTHLLDGASLGFFSKDGKRTWRADQRPGQSIPTAEWRQEDPGIFPAGDIYGGGAPTGMTFYENGALPEKYRGLLLSCETGRNTVFGYLPKPLGASFALERFSFLSTNRTGEFKGSDFVGGSNNLATEKPFFFRPSGVRVGPDGAIYVSDWFDPRTGGHTDLDESCSGTIYRIASKGFRPQVPVLDLQTTEGQLAALQSPANNVRQVGFARLKQLGAAALEPVLELSGHEDPYIAARAVWLLAQLGEAGQERVRQRLENADARQRLLAFRALRAAGVDVAELAEGLVRDPHPAVRAEVAVALKDVILEEAKHLLVMLAEQYDGVDRVYLEAWGIGCANREDAVWQSLLLAQFGDEGVEKPGADDPLLWTPAFARLTWRLTPQAAVGSLMLRAKAGTLSEVERRLALDTLAFIPTQESAEAMLSIAKSVDGGLRDHALWWVIKRSNDEWADFGLAARLKEEGLFDPDAVELVAVSTPEPPETVPGYSLDEVLALPGDAARGALAVQRCYMCHRVDGTGVDFGPELTGWGRSQPPSVIAEAIMDPSKDIAHGFDGVQLTTRDGLVIQGMLLTDGEIVIIRSLGGQTQYVPRKRIAKREKMTRSMMYSAAQLGLSAQDVADLISYMQK